MTASTDGQHRTRRGKGKEAINKGSAKATTRDIIDNCPIVEKFMNVLEDGPQSIFNGSAFPPYLARALCYWPVYVQLFEKVCKGGLSHRVAEAFTSLANNSWSKLASNGRKPNWTFILIILLTSTALGEPNNTINTRLHNLYKRTTQGKRTVFADGLELSYYYRFAAGFQGWLAYHLTVNWYRIKQDTIVPRICMDCKAHVPHTEPTVELLYLFYESVSKTRGAFRSIFGIDAADVPLGDQKTNDNHNELLEVPLLSESWFPKNPLKEQAAAWKQLWSELIWMMQEVEGLAWAHANIGHAQRLVHRWIERPEKVEHSVSDKEFWIAWLFKQLKVEQTTLFVRSHSETKANRIGYDTQKSMREENIALPFGWNSFSDTRDESSNSRTDVDIFDQVITKLYGEGLEKQFFNSLIEPGLSSTNFEQNFPFVIIPDGEINLYYASIIAMRGVEERLQLITKATEIDELCRAHTGSFEQFWSQKGWWIPNNADERWGIFPAPVSGQEVLHHRCAAMLATTYMCMPSTAIDGTEEAIDDRETRMRLFQKQLAAIRTTFCPVDEKGTLRSEVKQPHVLLSEFIQQKDTLVLGGLAPFFRIDSVRIGFLPEILLRSGDRESSTLFFLPIGQEGRSGDMSVPAAMIAGTLRGVEKRWLPFNPSRVIAHLEPISHALRPMLDTMVHKALLQGELSRLETAKQRREAAEQKTKNERLHTRLSEMIGAINLLNIHAIALQSETIPASTVLLDEDISRSLDELFALDKPVEYGKDDPSVITSELYADIRDDKQ
ncbi:MAG: hypothetical protein MN733_20990 [Nitrososphaera sp.]|nr:hypothetical protein [Nitrososphaera sp.]